MVEGHSVHRVAHRHRTNLVGSSFKATSPNGRFTAGAALISALTFSAIEAVGKNLFAFFGDIQDPHVVHVHFGMSGAWAIHPSATAPPPTPTTRLRLEGSDSKGCQVVVDLSAMTCNIGGLKLYEEKRAKLGEDPLRTDADPMRLWERVTKSKKGIGALIMDQSYFTGPGNIYRAEILLKAGVHPEIRGNELSKDSFDKVWHHTVDLLQRGYTTGSIVTVDESDARTGLRRYIYNSPKCGKCGGKVKSWDIAGRTCYACEVCQPREMVTSEKDGSDEGKEKEKLKKEKNKEDHKPFISHCARDDAATRLERGGAALLTVAEIRKFLKSFHSTTPPKGLKKAALASLLDKLRAPAVDAAGAAREKADAGEAHNVVEHVAELSRDQARCAREKTTPVTPPVKRKAVNVKPEKKKVKRGKLIE